jgi:hypothetical protein
VFVQINQINRPLQNTPGFTHGPKKTFGREARHSKVHVGFIVHSTARGRPKHIDFPGAGFNYYRRRLSHPLLQIRRHPVCFLLAALSGCGEKHFGASCTLDGLDLIQDSFLIPGFLDFSGVNVNAGIDFGGESVVEWRLVLAESAGK